MIAFIAQLVEHDTDIARITYSNTGEALNGPFEGCQSSGTKAPCW